MFKKTLRIACMRVVLFGQNNGNLNFTKRMKWFWACKHDKTNKMTCTPSEDPDQPGHLPSLIWVFPVCMHKRWVFSYSLSTQQRLWSDWANDLSLRWAHRSFCWFCNFVAHFSSVHQRSWYFLQPQDRVRRSKKTFSRDSSIPMGLGRQSSTEVRLAVL